MVRRDRVRNGLEQHGLSCPWGCHDQAALSLADRRQQVEHSSGEIVLSIRGLELQPFVGVQRRKVVEEDLVAGLIRVFEVDGFDLDQGKVAFSILWRTHLA